MDPSRRPSHAAPPHFQLVSCITFIAYYVLRDYQWCKRALTRRKESRKRNLQFHLPLAVSITPQIRLLANDSSYVTLQDVYDQHCSDKGVTREDPVLQVAQKTREILEERGAQVSSTFGEDHAKKLISCQRSQPETN